MSFAELLTGNRLVRKAADTMLARFSRKRTLYLDRTDPAELQNRTLMELVHRAKGTKFGREHGFESIATVADYQARVPVRDYEAFWNDYWQPVFPRLENVTWPSRIPYYALSSGTTSGTTKFVPISNRAVRRFRDGTPRRARC